MYRGDQQIFERRIYWRTWKEAYQNIVIAQGCGQTLGLGLGQSKDIVVVIIRKDWEESRQELGLGMMLRDKGFLWCTHGVHMYSGD